MTNRGRPIALLSPPPAASSLDRLRALGDVDAAMGDLADVPNPPILAPRVEPASAVLRRLRRNGR